MFYNLVVVIVVVGVLYIEVVVVVVVVKEEEEEEYADEVEEEEEEEEGAKCMQGCAPLYLRELLVKQANTRTLRSNTKNLLQIPLTNLKRFGDRAFCAYAPRLWNELPDIIKAADSVQNLKKQLKILLFRKELIDYMDHENCPMTLKRF